MLSPKLSSLEVKYLIIYNILVKSTQQSHYNMRQVREREAYSAISEHQLSHNNRVVNDKGSKVISLVGKLSAIQSNVGRWSRREVGRAVPE